VVYDLDSSLVMPSFTPFPCPKTIASFIYYISVPAGTEAKKNKQGCSLARKGHENGVIVFEKKLLAKL